jgi:bacteriochlorophyllide a dehydrogenase
MEWFETAAVVLSRPRVPHVQQVRCRAPLSGEVRIRTLYSGVSTGTDKWVMQGRFVWGSPVFPFVPGYQRCGFITAVGPATDGFRVNQQVVATTTVGLECVRPASGGHLADAVSPIHEVYDATGIDPRAASLFVCGQVGLNAASRLTVPAGGRVVVVGDGIIGASAALAARMRGYEVMIVGRHTRRLDAIARDGIVAVHTRADARVAVLDFQPAAAIDTVQSDESFACFVDAIPRETGEVVFSGHSPDGITHWADMAELQKREHTTHFVSGWKPGRVKRTLAAIRSGDMPLGELIGVTASGRSGIEHTVGEVVDARLASVAAVLDWSDRQ